MTFTEERAWVLSGADRDVSLMAKDQYLRQVRSAFKLTADEQMQLLCRVQRGNGERKKVTPNQWFLSLGKHACEQLVEALQPLVIRVVRYWMHRFKDGTDFLDLVQQANLGLLEALDSYEDGDFVRLAMRAMSRSLSHLRYRDNLQKADSLQAHLFEDEEESDLDFVGLYTTTAAYESERQQELAEVFQQALENALAPRQREIIQLMYGLGETPTHPRTQKELSQEFGVIPSTITSQVPRAYKRLAEVLTPVLDEKRQVHYVLDPVYQEIYCSYGEAISIFGATTYQLSKWVHSGQLPFWQGKDTRSGHGKACRFFLKQDICKLLGLSLGAVPGCRGSVVSCDESEVA